VSYGYIRYFIQIEEQIHILTQDLKKTCILNDGHPLEIDLNNFYSIGKLQNSCTVFPISQVKCKCAITEINGLQEIFISQATDIEMHS
jgi:hypothetical protein